MSRSERIARGIRTLRTDVTGKNTDNGRFAHACGRVCNFFYISLVLALPKKTGRYRELCGGRCVFFKYF